jgi:hypothetical protein
MVLLSLAPWASWTACSCSKNRIIDIKNTKTTIKYNNDNFIFFDDGDDDDDDNDDDLNDTLFIILTFRTLIILKGKTVSRCEYTRMMHVY